VNITTFVVGHKLPGTTIVIEDKWRTVTRHLPKEVAKLWIETNCPKVDPPEINQAIVVEVTSFTEPQGGHATLGHVALAIMPRQHDRYELFKFTDIQ